MNYDHYNCRCPCTCGAAHNPAYTGKLCDWCKPYKNLPKLKNIPPMPDIKSPRDPSTLVEREQMIYERGFKDGFKAAQELK